MSSFAFAPDGVDRVRRALATALGICWLAACDASGGETYYCSPYLGLVSPAAIADLPDAQQAQAVVCPSGSACAAVTPSNITCGPQPDGSTAGDACPSFSCAPSDASDD